ncbi:MAG: hypothetical protein HC800_07270 [Phormidesmis sp. RL_2_1]|nr:hypothetical protein [Phormidesmis sp. RL_2_1]
MTGTLTITLPAQANNDLVNRRLSLEESFEAVILPVINVNVDTNIPDEPPMILPLNADNSVDELMPIVTPEILEPASEATTPEATPETSPSIMAYNQGVKNYRQGHYALAIDDFDAAIAADAHYAEAYVFRAAAQLKLNNGAAAMDDYIQAIATNPDYALAYFQEARSFTKWVKWPQP